MLHALLLTLLPGRALLRPLLQAHAALLRWVTGDAGADIQLATHPLPVLADEQDMKITEAAGGGSHAVLLNCPPDCLHVQPACLFRSLPVLLPWHSWQNLCRLLICHAALLPGCMVQVPCCW
jgi:hypothetical protein